MTPTQKRAAADYLVQQFRVPQRRAARVLQAQRSIIRYQPQPRRQEDLVRKAILKLTQKHVRYGYRRIHALLVRRGWTINRKRVRRLWTDMGLQRRVRIKTRKTGPKKLVGTSANSCVAKPARCKNDVWTCDLVFDRLKNGETLKWLTVVDEYTKECLALHAGLSITGADVRKVMSQIVARRGAPKRVRSDNGSEFVCEALTRWLCGKNAEPIPVAPGHPWENGYIESFNGKLRDEFLDLNEFMSLSDAKDKAKTFRHEYNSMRPHSSLNYKTPKEFGASCDVSE